MRDPIAQGIHMIQAIVDLRAVGDRLVGIDKSQHITPQSVLVDFRVQQSPETERQLGDHATFGLFVAALLHMLACPRDIGHVARLQPGREVPRRRVSLSGVPCT